MPDFEPVRIVEILQDHNVRFLVIGAIAAIVQGYPLNTRDLDITPARDSDNVERLVAALSALGARLRVPDDPEGVAFPLDSRMLAQAEVWTLTTAFGPLDLLFAPTGTHGYDDLRRNAVTVEVADRPVQVASLRDVIRMKEASNRPKDQAQLPALRQTLEVIRERERRR